MNEVEDLPKNVLMSRYARPAKAALNHSPMDIGFLSRLQEKLIRFQGGSKAVTVYASGESIVMDITRSDMAFVISEITNYEQSLYRKLPNAA